MKADYNYIESKIGDIANNTFNGRAISVSLLKLYCEEIRGFLKDYISERTEATYRENLPKVSSEKRGGFLNLEYGYIVSMTNWVNENPIIFPDTDFLKESQEEKRDRTQNISLSEIASRESVRILGLGSVVNIALWISGTCIPCLSSLKILSLFSETAVIGVGAYKMRSEFQARSQEPASERSVFEKKANDFIARVSQVALDYVQKAEIVSNEILNKFVNAI